MGTSLTGLTPATTYDALIKVGDNGPLSATAKYIGDGLGNDSVLALSTAVVGINTSSPNTSYPLSIASASNANAIAVFGRASDNTGSIDFYQSNGSSRILEFGVSTTQVDIYNDLNTPMLFSTNATERMRITGVGNVGIGTSAPTGTYGKLTVAGGITINPDTLAKLEIGRYSAGASNSYIKLGSTSGSLRITNAADIYDIVVIENNTTGEKLRVLESGGITFNGDTAAANALDDYEEGTWTPAVNNPTGTGSPSYGSRVGTYTKIGRQVVVQFYMEFQKNTMSGAALQMTGFPFTAQSNVYPESAILIDNLAVTLNNPLIQMAANTNVADLIEGNGSTASHAGLSVNTYLGAGTMNLRGTLTYFV